MGTSFFDSDDEISQLVMNYDEGAFDMGTHYPKPTIWQPKGGKGGTTYASCEHFRFPFPVGGGKFLYLSSSRGHDANLRKEDHVEVDYGVYLDAGWRTKLENKPIISYSGPLANGVEPPEGFLEFWENKPTPMPPLNGVYLPWQDRGAPPMWKIEPLLEWMNKELDSDRRIEVACMGGHGRTGTLAAMVLLSRAGGKVTPTQAIALVREVYCKEAIESWEQTERIFESVGEKAPDNLKPKSITSNNTSTKSKSVTPALQHTGISTQVANEIRLYNFGHPELRLAFPLRGFARKEVDSSPVTAGENNYYGLD